MGLLAVFFVLVFAISGLLLNHTSELGLQDKGLPAPMASLFYGAEAATADAWFRARSQVVSQWGSDLFIDASGVGPCPGELRGAARHGEYVAVLCGDQLLVFTETAELLEVLGAEHGLPASLTAIGESGKGGLVLQSAAGTYALSPQLVPPLVAATDASGVRWSEPVEGDAALAATIGSARMTGDLHVERLLLDLHSGRLFGFGGVVFMDVMAILVSLLALTGMVMWLHRPP